jgi:predicted transcriptional regulator
MRPVSKLGWLALVMEQPPEIIDPKARLVAAALVMTAERDALSVSTGIDLISMKAGLSPASVKRALQTLERDCWLRVRRARHHRGQSRRVTNVYGFVVPAWGPTIAQTMAHTVTTMAHCEPWSGGSERTTMAHSELTVRSNNKGLPETAQSNGHRPIRGTEIRAILNGTTITTERDDGPLS